MSPGARDTTVPRTGSQCGIQHSSAYLLSTRQTSAAGSPDGGDAAPRDPLPEHLVLCEAIAAGDPKRAHAAMGELLRLALEDMA